MKCLHIESEQPKVKQNMIWDLEGGCLRRQSECERKWVVRGAVGEAPAQGTPERGLAHDAATENVRWGVKVLSVGESAWVRDCALSEGVHVSSGEHIL